jgi:eukaryotic-like serine/threonine-protein kinase
VHRDLKPDNVFLTGDGIVKIMDFGLAKLFGAAVAQTESLATVTAPRTDVGVVLGTVGYMAPEQVRGLPADHRSDIFAFGAILYEMLAGTRAFRGATTADAMSAILNSDPPEIAGVGATVPTALDRQIRRCLEKDPQDRFQSARDLGLALQTIAPGSSDALSALPGRRRRHVREMVIGVGLVMVGVWLPGFSAGHPRRSRRVWLSRSSHLPAPMYRERPRWRPRRPVRGQSARNRDVRVDDQSAFNWAPR